MGIWEYFLLIGAVFFGGGIAFYFKKTNQKILDLVLAFSGAYILGIIMLHIIPETYAIGGAKVGAFVLLGFIIQIILEHLSQGIEHGHIHHGHHTNSSFAVSIMAGLCLHSFLEGMPVGVYSDMPAHDHNHLLFGILIHKMPAAFALVLLLQLSGYSRTITILCLSVFSIMTPLGALSAQIFEQQNILDKESIPLMVGIVIGSFLHIATTILFESEANKSHKLQRTKLAGIILGFIISLMTMH